MAVNGHSPTLGLVVPDELVEAIARRVAELVPAPDPPETDPWLDVDGAARHLGYGDGDEAKLERGRNRVYDLKAQGRLQWDKDGTRLVFRRSWLDRALKHQGEGSA